MRIQRQRRVLNQRLKVWSPLLYNTDALTLLQALNTVSCIYAFSSLSIDKAFASD